MTKVFAFDRDLTVSTSFGPVPLEVVVKLSRKYIVYSYGNPVLAVEAGIPYAEGLTKRRRLEWLMKQFPDADEYIVVDDEYINVLGWKYYDPKSFMNIVGRYL